MRVKGNILPPTVAIESHPSLPNYVELRIRENFKEISFTDELTGEDVQVYEYDEYVFTLRCKEGLREEVEEDLSDWLVTGRTLEVNEKASAVVDMKDTIEQDAITIDRMNTAGAEAMQSLGKEPPVSAGFFVYPEWQPDTKYKQYSMFTYNGNPYFAKQEHTSLAVYPPDAKGVESLYGARPSPDLDGVYPYIYNMAVELGMKVRSAKNGNIYKCYANATYTLVDDPVDAPAIFELV